MDAPAHARSGAAAASGLPAPPAAQVPRPRPSGRPGNLAVLDWAGFRAAVSYTLDDSQPSHLEHYPALQATGVRMTFYLSSETASCQVPAWRRMVADGHEIGNHTVHHCHVSAGPDPVLSGCVLGTLPPSATAGSEIDETSAFIAGPLGQGGVWTMASPYGDANWGALAATRFLASRDTRPGMVAPRDDTDPFHLPSYPVGAEPAGAIPGTRAALDAVLEEARAGGRWALLVLHSLAPTRDVWYAPVDVRELLAHLDRMKSLGDVWADAVVNVAAYWRAQKLLAGLAPSTARGRTTWRWELPPGFPPGRYLRVRVDGGALTQGGVELRWDEHGYYEVALDAAELTLVP